MRQAARPRADSQFQRSDAAGGPHRSGCDADRLGIARDEADELRTAINKGLEADILLVTGGVSAGVMDLVPAVLAELGVEQVFHKVRMKPGKPLWFGNARSR